MGERLKELSNMAQGTDQKIKSQRGGSVDIFVENRVKWPHEFVLSVPLKERVSYNNLTILQWVAGFCRIMKEEKDLGVREHMLDYMISLLDDAQDFSWQAAKASHTILLCLMEQGKISDWRQVDFCEFGSINIFISKYLFYFHLPFYRHDCSKN